MHARQGEGSEIGRSRAWLDPTGLNVLGQLERRPAGALVPRVKHRRIVRVDRVLLRDNARTHQRALSKTRRVLVRAEPRDSSGYMSLQGLEGNIRG